MLREIPPAWISQKKSLEAVSCDQSQEPEKGSLSADGSFCWMYRGSWMTVTSLGNENDTRSRANFAELLEESSLQVQSVTELKDHLSATDPDVNSSLLVVVLNRKVVPAAQIPTSVVCVYDSRLGKITRAIDCPFAVRLAEPVIVSDSGRAPSLIACVHEQLESFHGLLAVGCEGGLVSFVDLCLDQEVKDILPIRKLTFAARNTGTHSYDIDTKRRRAIVHGQHVSLPLNAECQSKHYFHYKTGGEERSEPRPIGRVFVTCVKYIPQINALCIAYNFGGYHIYDLKSLQLLFRGDTNQVETAVVDFSFLEPEEDPKNHCYLWMTRGSTVKEFMEDGVASIHLNVMTFEQKNWLEDFGYQYSHFVSSSCIFDYECTGFPYLADRENCSYSVIIKCGSLEQGSPWYYKSSEDDSANDLSMFYVAWEATNDASDSPLTYFAVFDLNQYYQAQMPRAFDVSKENHLCPYFGIFSLSEVTAQLPNETILDFRISPNSIRRYRTNLFNHDLHYFPCSLSFDSAVLAEKSFLEASFLGLQRLTLSKISSAGPAVLVDPKDALKNCFIYGLIPQQPINDTKCQRMTLLRLMLENEQLPFLINIIKCWSTQEFDHIGMRMDLMLEWLWAQVSVVKNSLEAVSKPLFPSSSEVFDENFAVKTMYSYEVDLNNLLVLLNKILEHPTVLTHEVKEETEKRRDITHMMCLHIRIMLWMIDCKLLPEVAESEQKREGAFQYPWSILRSNYKERRKRLKCLNPTAKTTSFLMIDGIVESVKDSLCTFWKNSGGDSVFPPRGLFALLGMYLLDNIPLDRKHQIMQYFLLDMAAILTDDKPDIVEKIKRFSSAISLKQSLVDFIEGSWALDSGQMFDYSLQQLMKPGVKKEYFTLTNEEDAAFKSDLHHRVIVSLVLQGEPLKAQHFASICKLSAGDVLPVKDFAVKVKAEMLMLLTNNQPLEALDLVRRHRGNEKLSDLFMHFMSGIEKTGEMSNILKLALDREEQDSLHSYLLHHSKSPQAKKVLILHLLTRNLVMEADKILDIIRIEDQAVNDAASGNLLEGLALLVDRYKKTLPVGHFQAPVIEGGDLSERMDGGENVGPGTANKSSAIQSDHEYDQQPPSDSDSVRKHAMTTRASSRKK